MRILFITVALTLGFTTVSADEATDTTKAAYGEPVLLTAAGQAADVLIMKGLCKRAGLVVEVKNQATGDSLDGFAAVILVAGGSSKGLGAAKVDVGDERARVEKLVKTANEKKIPILAFHIGGEARRGALSDPFNELAARSSELVVVAADGDEDGFFKKIAKKEKSGYRHVEKSLDTVPVLKELFGK